MLLPVEEPMVEQMDLKEEPRQEWVVCWELLPVRNPCWSSLLFTDGPRGMDPCSSSS